ncbi:MAG: YitT family protein [Paludibacter sp.]|nr:YitT family protein [Paludibacter sp.]
MKQMAHSLTKNTSKNKKTTLNRTLNLLHDSIFIALGIVSAGFGLKGFLLPNSFIDGGVTGISLILTEVTKISFPILLVAINLPFILVAFSTVNKQFAFRSFLAIVLLALTVHFIPFPIITHDKLLIAVFGGFFLGLGIGLAMRGGSVIDGTEVLAVYLGRKTSLTIGDVILIFNVMIFMVSAYVFSVEIALYAILTYLAASKTVDFVVSGIEEYVGVTIISDKNEEIRLAIIEKLGRGCTLYYGKKGYAKRGETLKKTDIVYTLITRLEISKLKSEIDNIDKDAFIVMHSIKDVKGGMIKKRPMQQ